MSRKRVAQVYEYVRDVASQKLLANPVLLGGQGVVVQIDESLFAHKRKHNRGRVPNDNGERWVFGMVDTSTTPAIGYMEIVDRRDAGTLLPIIQQHVRPGSIIHSDQWRAYQAIGPQLGGTLSRGWLQSNLALDHSISLLDSVYNMLDFRLFWYLWLSGALLHHLWHFGIFLFKIFNSEVYEFPLEAPILEQEELCLHQVLSTTVPFVKYQAFHDLHNLAEHSKKRRKWIYSLSQPGGHPHRWNRVYSQCVELIDSLTNQLLAYHDELASGKSLQRQFPSVGQKANQSSNVLTNSVDHPAVYQTALNGSHDYSQTYSRPIWTEGYQSIENLGVDSPYSSAHECYQPHSTQLRRRPIHSDDSVGTDQPPVYRRETRLQRLKQLRLVAYLLEPLPDAASRALFTDCQLHIWALEALSALVICSYSEDTFGVVQQTIPTILLSMLALNNALDKHFKLLSNIKEHGQLKDILALKSSTSVAQLRVDLRGSLKTSLHGIIATFGHNLHNIHLSPEYKKQLTQLMEYKE